MSTSIQWTDETWNPTTGCTRVSEGCRNCYIERTPAFRINKRKFVNGSTGVLLHPDRLDKPLHWKKPRRVFVNSLSDLFHPDIPDEFIHQVFEVMANAAWIHGHTFQVLTKRPERMKRVVDDIYAGIREQAKGKKNDDGLRTIPLTFALPLERIWLGVSVENQETADERIPFLLQTPAAVRFISAEPLLEAVSFRWASWDTWKDGNDVRRDRVDQYDGLRMLDWIILGGESGPGARPCDLAWIRSMKDQCQAAQVPVFVKQLGRRAYSEKDFIAYPKMRFVMAKDGYYRFLNDKKGGDMAEWPDDLRVRQYPTACGVRVAGERL